jgi:hypothetical protein
MRALGLVALVACTGHGAGSADGPLSLLPDGPLSLLPDAPLSLLPDGPLNGVRDAPVDAPAYADAPRVRIVINGCSNCLESFLTDGVGRPPLCTCYEISEYAVPCVIEVPSDGTLYLSWEGPGLCGDHFCRISSAVGCVPGSALGDGCVLGSSNAGVVTLNIEVSPVPMFDCPDGGY